MIRPSHSRALWRTSLVAALALMSACAKEVGGSADRVSLRVFAVKYEANQEDPYFEVKFVRVVVTQGAEVISDKFFTFDKAVGRSLDFIPFGQNLQVTIEGWSSVDGVSPGQLLSRGRSSLFSMDEDGAAIELAIGLSRLSVFSYTSQAGVAAGGATATSLQHGRFGQTVTDLGGGKVLIAGGLGFKAGKTGDFTDVGQIGALYKDCEIFNTATGEFSQVGNLVEARAFHTASLLPDGSVLIAGGVGAQGSSPVASNTFERYDKLTGTFSLIPEVQMAEGRAGHTATVLDANGNVLLAGGFGLDAESKKVARSSGEVVCVSGFSCSADAPSLSKIVFSDIMVEARAFHTAELVNIGASGDRKAVLLIGGEGTDAVRATTETFFLTEPAGFQEKPVADLPTMVGGPRTRHTATYVHEQRYIHVVGGFKDLGHTNVVQQIDSFDIRQSAFQQGTGFFSVEGRGGHAAVKLERNTVLVFGGFGCTTPGENCQALTPLSSAEIIFEKPDPNDPSKRYIDRGTVGSMLKARGGPSAVFLENGTALAVGGVDAAGNFATAGEFFNPQ